MRNTQLKKRSGSILGLWKIDMFFILVIFDKLLLNGHQHRSVQPTKMLYVHLEGNIFQIQSQGFSVEGKIKHMLYGYNPIVSIPCSTFITFIALFNVFEIFKANLVKNIKSSTLSSKAWFGLKCQSFVAGFLTMSAFKISKK